VERQDFIRDEVRKLLHASFIEEVYHPEWLANPVVVPKANGKLRMCIDYTNLNKACPRDPYPLPCIDGLFCYVVMPYGLRNALPTFVRAMNKTFGDLIRDKVEVYVDDIVVKTKKGSTLLEDLALVFDRLRVTRMKLNPDKCVFGVSAGKLLGFLVSHRGIEANPTKIKAIETMRPPARIKDVQRLTGCLAALILFISRLAEKALPFFKLLRGSGPFTWTEEAEQAFQELKQHLTTLPILVAPELGETLFLYLTASSEAVSMVLVAERTVQSGQGGRVVSLAKDDGPTIMEVEDGPEPGGPDPNPGGPGVEPDSQGP